MNTTTEQRAALRKRADWIARNDLDNATGVRMLVPVAEVLALLNTIDDLNAGPRPDGCCGKCQPIVGGGYDCTCAGNPRCANTLDFGTTTDTELALAQGLLRNPDNGELR